MKDIEKELMDSSNQIPETNISAYEILEKAENKERISSPKKARISARMSSGSLMVQYCTAMLRLCACRT